VPRTGRTRSRPRLPSHRAAFADFLHEPAPVSAVAKLNRIVAASETRDTCEHMFDPR
jgi:hypothetical protein